MSARQSSAREIAPSRAWLAVVDGDPELGELLRDAFSGTHEVALVARLSSMSLTAELRPAVIILPPPRADSRGLDTWEVVALTRAHRDLRAVPLIVLTPDLDRAMSRHAERLQRFSDVWVVSMPFDLEVLESVVATAGRPLATGPTISASVA